MFITEKSRIVKPPEGERNYHIFYQVWKKKKAKKTREERRERGEGLRVLQLLAGTTPEEKKRYFLENLPNSEEGSHPYCLSSSSSPPLSFHALVSVTLYFISLPPRSLSRLLLPPAQFMPHHPGSERWRDVQDYKGITFLVLSFFFFLPSFLFFLVLFPSPSPSPLPLPLSLPPFYLHDT